jgi:hypothetical protein
MKFYHYTKQENLMGIAVNGLTPTIDDEVRPLTMGQEVVWLTTQETLKPTEEDLAWMRAHRKPEIWTRFTETLMLDKEMRLTVNLDPRMHRKKLFHYHTWMYEGGLAAINPDTQEISFTGRDVLETIGGIAPSNKKHWWIYLGTIKPSRIELNPTAERMLPGIEHNLASAIKEGDAERVKALTEMRDKVSALEPDCLLNLQVAA